MTTTTERPVPFLTLVGWTTLATLFLFFIDEGNLSLDGLWEMHNLVPMAIYFAGILAVTALLVPVGAVALGLGPLFLRGWHKDIIARR